MANKLNLDKIQVPGLESMTDEIAQVFSGGALTLYEHHDFEGRTKTIENQSGIVNLSDFNDITSSVRIDPGEVWALYEHFDGEGRIVAIIDGAEGSISGRAPFTSIERLEGSDNDLISSVGQIDPFE